MCSLNRSYTNAESFTNIQKCLWIEGHFSVLIRFFHHWIEQLIVNFKFIEFFSNGILISDIVGALDKKYIMVRLWETFVFWLTSKKFVFHKSDNLYLQIPPKKLSRAHRHFQNPFSSAPHDGTKGMIQQFVETIWWYNLAFKLKEEIVILLWLLISFDEGIVCWNRRVSFLYAFKHFSLISLPVVLCVHVSVKIHFDSFLLICLCVCFFFFFFSDNALYSSLLSS